MLERNASSKSASYPLCGELHELLSCILNVVGWSSNSDTIAGGTSRWEANDDATTLVHHRTNEAAFSTDD